ncbi:MAG: recombinase family protein [Planctomycetales bacterium]|nr:recombinase family protein [Planctomycetales bacterium]
MRRNGNGAPATAAPPATTRCAIYTRKSTEEGLDQDFNSLDAQRESAEAFIKSQRGEGWEVLPDRYDDGGFTGGNMERPAMKRLLDDIEAGRVNAIVVYKVDRLSRSLLDFARIMEVLDQHRVAFVSVTQQFNTATSMGRLVLHILLSFAQFEREMIAERTRDKMSAARRKGKWTGGMPILGYDVDPKGGRLLVNDAEAARVREIFELYLKEQSLVATAVALNGRGSTTKSWITKKGRPHEGAAFTKSNLFGLLSNVAYIGQVSHKGTAYPGEQPAIVDGDLWRRTQEVLRHNGRTGGKSVRNKHGALLKELLRCVPCDASMIHTWTVKDQKRYRYYVCLKAQKQGWTSCPTKAVPAQEVERFVVERIRAIGRDRDVVGETIEQARAQHAAHVKQLEAERQAAEKELKALNAELRRLLGSLGENGAATDRLADLQDKTRAAEQRMTEVRERAIAASRQLVDERDLSAALSLFDPVWEALFPREQARIMRLLVERVGYDGREGTLAITFRPTGIKALAQEINAGRKEVRK